VGEKNEKEDEENKMEKAKKLSSTRSLLIVSGVQPICSDVSLSLSLSLQMFVAYTRYWSL
jgi:hypothetical protein